MEIGITMKNDSDVEAKLLYPLGSRAWEVEHEKKVNNK